MNGLINKRHRELGWAEQRIFLIKLLKTENKRTKKYERCTMETRNWIWKTVIKQSRPSRAELRREERKNGHWNEKKWKKFCACAESARPTKTVIYQAVGWPVIFHWFSVIRLVSRRRRRRRRRLRVMSQRYELACNRQAGSLLAGKGLCLIKDDQNFSSRFALFQRSHSLGVFRY